MRSDLRIISRLLNGASGAVVCWVLFTFNVRGEVDEWLWLLPVMLLVTEVGIILHSIGKDD